MKQIILDPQVAAKVLKFCRRDLLGCNMKGSLKVGVLGLRHLTLAPPLPPNQGDMRGKSFLQ